MKLRFVGIDLEPKLRQALAAANYEIIESKSAADILVVKCVSQRSLPQLDKLRRESPDAWIIALTDRANLLQPDFHTALLQNPSKDDVWIEPSWRDQLWLLLQRATRSFTLRTSSKEFEQRYRRLLKEHQGLANHTQLLVEQVERDVALASSIQRTLLPKFSPEVPGVSIAVKYIPAAGLGGDYYDIFELGDNRRFGVLLADSKSHGMAALLLSALLRVRLDEVKSRFPRTNQLVEYINRELEQAHAADQGSLSLLYGIYDRATLQFRYTTAGHLAPMLWRDGHKQDIPLPPCPALGGLDRFDFPENELMLKPGDLLFFHTDGLEKCAGKRVQSQVEKMLGDKTYPVDPIELQNDIMGLINRYTQDQPSLEDDLTIIQFSVSQKALYVAAEKTDQSK